VRVIEIVMAVALEGRGTVGCCYYVAREETLYFMEDVRFGSVDVVDVCKFTARVAVNFVYQSFDDCTNACFQ
jgi:DNA mismatch repair protein MSH5